MRASSYGSVIRGLLFMQRAGCLCVAAFLVRGNVVNRLKFSAFSVRREVGVDFAGNNLFATLSGPVSVVDDKISHQDRSFVVRMIAVMSP